MRRLLRTALAEPMHAGAPAGHNNRVMGARIGLVLAVAALAALLALAGVVALLPNAGAVVGSLAAAFALGVATGYLTARARGALRAPTAAVRATDPSS